MLLARMGLALDLPPRPVRGELMNGFRELHVARLALIKDRTAAGNRADTAAIGLIRNGAAEAVHANKWQTQHRYMQVEAFARIDTEEIDPILGITTKAA